MRSTPSRSTRWFAALLVLWAPLTLASGPAIAAKPKAKAAVAKKHKPAGETKSSDSKEPAAKKEAEPYETPSPAPTEPAPGAPGSATSTATSTDTSTSTETSTSTATEPAKEAEKPEEPRPLAEPPAPPPKPAEPIPATVVTSHEAPAVETPAPYVEHLGPQSFPGRLRGLYGGSLWLEPSFNGLQWPFMARTGVGVSGTFWVDNGYEMIIRDDQNRALPNTHMTFQQGRAVLRLTPAYVHGRFFIQGQVELVGNECQAATTVCTTTGTFSTDDLWIRFGQWNAWDVKVGRFEAWEIYHLGMGMDMYTIERMGAQQFGIVNNQDPNQPFTLDAPTFYGVNYLHDRPTEGWGLGYAALHAYFTEAARIEVLAELGTDNYRADDTTSIGSTYLGARPAFIYDIGWFKLKAALEYQQRTAVTQVLSGSGQKQDASYYRTRMGGGASLQFVMDPRVEFGANVAYGRQRQTDPLNPSNNNQDPQSSFTTITLGGFANLRLANLWLAGIGANWTTQTDLFYASGSGTADYTAHLQGFAALQYLLGGQLFIKAVLGFARADFSPSDRSVQIWSNYMYSARVRLMYLY